MAADSRARGGIVNVTLPSARLTRSDMRRARGERRSRISTDGRLGNRGMGDLPLPQG